MPRGEPFLPSAIGVASDVCGVISTVLQWRVRKRMVGVGPFAVQH
jgi:hypothetical protein